MQTSVALEAVVLPVEHQEEGVVIVAAFVGADVAFGEGGEAVGVEETREAAQRNEVLCAPVARPSATDRVAGGEVNQRQRSVGADDGNGDAERPRNDLS